VFVPFTALEGNVVVFGVDLLGVSAFGVCCEPLREISVGVVIFVQKKFRATKRLAAADISKNGRKLEEIKGTKAKISVRVKGNEWTFILFSKRI